MTPLMFWGTVMEVKCQDQFTAKEAKDAQRAAKKMLVALPFCAPLRILCALRGLIACNVIQPDAPSADSLILITTDFETGVLLLSATLLMGTSTLVSGK